MKDLLEGIAMIEDEITAPEEPEETLPEHANRSCRTRSSPPPTGSARSPAVPCATSAASSGLC